jgi:hypothetical protein
MSENSDDEIERTGEEVTDAMVKEAAYLWASDWRTGDPPPIGIHRLGNKPPAKYRATVMINGVNHHGPIRDDIEDCIADRRKLLIQFKRITRMKGKRKTNPKYYEDEDGGLQGDSGKDANAPFVTHIVELVQITPHTTVEAPPRHLCPVALAMRVSGVQIADSFLWSALMIDGVQTSADVFGYGQSHLQAYVVGLLSDYNICPTQDAVQTVVSAVSQQLDFSRAATLLPEESSLVEKGKYRRFPPIVNVTLYDEVSGYSDKFCWNAWSTDATVRRFCTDIAAQWRLSGKSRLDIEFQLLSQSIAHRQKFLDQNPHIHTGIQRIFRKSEIKTQPEIRSKKVQERIERLNKMRAARKCFQKTTVEEIQPIHVPEGVPGEDAEDEEEEEEEGEEGAVQEEMELDEN